MYAAIVTAISAALFAAADDAAGTAEPIRVVMITGDDHPGHRWKETGPVIREILEREGRFRVEIVEDLEFLASDELFAYDLLFLHFKNYKPLARADRAKANLKRFVGEGKGLVVFHFACGAFEDWPEFGKIAGRVWDRKTGHDPRGPFAVKIVDQEHPITWGMENFQADDELYTCLIGEQPVRLLATARSKVTGKDHPMAFVLRCGQGRVFHTPLGHDVKAIQIPAVAELICRGCAWAAGREPTVPR